MDITREELKNQLIVQVNGKNVGELTLYDMSEYEILEAALKLAKQQIGARRVIKLVRSSHIHTFGVILNFVAEHVDNFADDC